MLPLYYAMYMTFVYGVPVYIFRMHDSYYSSKFENVQATMSFIFGLFFVCASQICTSLLRQRVADNKITEEKAVVAEGFLFWLLLCSTFSFFLSVTYFVISFGWWMDILCAIVYGALLGAGIYYRRGILLIFGAVGLFLLITDAFVSMFTGDIWAAGLIMTIVGLTCIAAAVGWHHYYNLHMMPESERQNYEDIENTEGAPLTYNGNHPRNGRGSYQYGEEMVDMGSFVGGSSSPAATTATHTTTHTTTAIPKTTTTPVTTTTTTAARYTPTPAMSAPSSKVVRAVATPIVPSALASAAAPFTIADYDDVHSDSDDDQHQHDSRKKDTESPSLTRHVPNL
eukprot:TRINITY_DN715_c0_g1_i2.p1 TRINITY_DN715_c0_g1~~TRINITY_DN715_c0_g1_i2.p1  ORF type:complete len:340 (-),score=78.25 TRINITY_DN715_c0_g1_i2:108-1127(-)